MRILTILIPILIFGQKIPKQVDRVLDRIELTGPVEYKNLRIFPIESRFEAKGLKLITLDQAVKFGYLEIKEVGSGEVNWVRVRNKGKKPVFIMSGEMITGAKQDRMIKEDVLIPAKSGWVKIPVFCTERGRWAYKSEKFSAPEMGMSGKVRQKARLFGEQTRVWAEISISKRNLGVTGKTDAFQDVYRDEKLTKRAKAFQDKLSKIPRLGKRTIGVIVAVGDEILVVDIFANHDLFLSLWKKLLNSYIVDALQEDSRNTVTIVKAQRFLNRIRAAGFESNHTPGLGNLYRFESTDLAGSALTYKGSLIHLDAFPSEDDRSNPIPSLQRRRESRFED